jgi:hypothetical protein
MSVPPTSSQALGILLLVGTALLLACGSTQDAQSGPPPQEEHTPASTTSFDEATERAAVEEAIRGMIGWALTKDFDLLYSIPVHDSTYLSVHPGNNVVKGYADFLEGTEWFRSPDFRAVRFQVWDLQITFSWSGDVAWYFCMLDDENEWQGRPASWLNTRWTGVLEKRHGAWRMAQMHFSFASEG